MKRFTMLLAVVALLVVPAAAGAWKLELTVAEPAGIDRQAEPVSGGIPLPEGKFKADQAFSLLDGGKEIPVQVLPLVVGPDGGLRWVLVDFQADLKAKETRTFTLKDAKGSAAPAKPLSVEKAAGGVTVDTGVAKFTVAADKPFSLLSTASAGGKPVLAGGEVSYTDGFDGKRYVADKPDSIEVNYAGPLRTTLSVKGGFVGDDNNKLRYIARITAWAGHSDVHVKYSLANSNPDHYAYRQVKDSTVSLKLAGGASGGLVGAGKPLEAQGDFWMQQSERVVPATIDSADALGLAKWTRATPGAKDPGGATAMAGGKELWVSAGKGDVSQGWVAAKSAAGTVFVTDLYFVEDPPRKLGLADGSLVLTGITEPLEGTQAPFNEKTRWLFDCSHLSSQYVIDLAAAGDAAKLSSEAREARNRVWAVAPPSWYFETAQLPVGRFGTRDDELKCYDTWGWEYDKNKVPQGLAGNLERIQRWTYADDNHFISEQDTTDALLLMFMRTGDRAFFDAAESWANYFMDLQTWRTDGWRWKDGGVWWHGGPAGNRPQRAADPVTGLRNSLPAEWTKSMKTKLGEWDRARCLQVNSLFLAKACKCHNWGEGLVEWFMLTGDVDAYEAAIDTVEVNFDAQGRASRREPGKASGYSRDFTRACYLTNATRLIAPTDEFVVKASDFLAACYLQRPDKEPRGLLNDAGPVKGGLSEKALKDYVGEQGIAEMKRLGIQVDAKTGKLTDPKTGAEWYPITGPATWMYPPLSRAMELYYRITGDEDALDWLVAYGQAVAHVLFQPRHGNLSGKFLLDFPKKGVSKDQASWVLPDDAKNGEGVRISGYLGGFHPDIPARAYTYTGDEFLKKRAYDYWYYASHRGYNATKMHNLGGVGQWINLYSTHNENVCFTGRTFYEWAHPRADTQAPAAVGDLSVSVSGGKATVSFTAPTDAGGKVARYQLKCSDKPIVDYQTFLEKFAANEDAAVANWWMAANVAGEPAPAAGGKVSFTVDVPEGAKFFAVRSFDDSSNRSPLSNVAEAK